MPSSPPPRGQEATFASAKERIGAHLRAQFPELTFELSETGLYDEGSILPICGMIQDDGKGPKFAPPSQARVREIEAALLEFDMRRTGLN